MWPCIGVLLVLLSVAGSRSARADELAFPQTEVEIVAALSLKDGRTTYNLEVAQKSQQTHESIKIQ